MDLNIIRAGIFLTAGLLTIIFGKQLNNVKNRVFKKLNMNSLVNERNDYIYAGIFFIIISIGLFIFSIVY